MAEEGPREDLRHGQVATLEFDKERAAEHDRETKVLGLGRHAEEFHDPRRT